jgi:RNA-directed DNA polymerase
VRFPWLTHPVIHCKTKGEAISLLEALKNRLRECFLELHPEKTKIIYCKDANRKNDDHDKITFDFLGYTFQPRRSRTRRGKIFLNFSPAISGKAKRKIKEVIRGWRLPARTGEDLKKIAREINPQVRGWLNYYGKFYRSALYSVIEHIEYKLCLWARGKYKRLKGSKEQARQWLGRIRTRQRSPLFVHWNFTN